VKLQNSAVITAPHFFRGNSVKKPVLRPCSAVVGFTLKAKSDEAEEELNSQEFDINIELN
jgi:hypothetical protein